MMGVNKYRRVRNEGCRITDDLLYKGYRSVLLENEQLLVHLLLDKGSEPVRWLHKPTDTDFIWFSEKGLHHAHPLYADYQTSYIGGWQEMFPEVSYTHEYRGATLHRGECAVTPWDLHILEDDPDQIRVKLVNRSRTLPVRIEKTLIMKSGSATVRIEETVYNEAPVTAIEANWGHHLAYGSPFLTEHSTVCVDNSAKIVHPASGESWKWPNMQYNGEIVDLSKMPAPGTHRDLLYIDTPDGKYQLSNPQKQVALEVRWNREVWPYLWYWQNFMADQQFPFYGCDYNIGLEMFNIPPKLTVKEAVEQNMALIIAPQGSISSWLEFEVLMK